MARSVTLDRGTSKPTTAPTVNSTIVDSGSAVIVYGTTGTGSGSCQLWCWEQDGAAGAGDWYPVGDAFTISSSTNSGKFRARFAVDLDRGAYYFLQGPSSITESLIRGGKL